MNIVDIHAHILPNIDDGARHMNEALEMLRNAAASDVSAIVATPHCNLTGMFENYSSAMLLDSLNALRKRAEAENIPVELFPGAEVRAARNLPQLLESGCLLTLNNSRYLLTEFAPDDSAGFIIRTLREILAYGCVPVVAHPERYYAVWVRPQIVVKWLDLGCHIQLTAGSILGQFGQRARKTADCLLENDLVACIASDAHDTIFRTNYLGEAYACLQNYYPDGYAQVLMYDNPMRICRNQPL